MAIQSELYGLKSAGTYRFEKDQSVTLTTVAPLENIRMLVGFSKKGPFNTPVLINTTKEFIDTFGDIDRSLERRVLPQKLPCRFERWTDLLSQPPQTNRRGCG